MTITLNGTTGITDVNGTAAAPAITGTDTDSGVYFGTNTVGLSTNGTAAVTVDSSQNVTITGTATATKLIPTSTSVTGNGMYLPATNAVGISTAGLIAVYIDANQNVDIGTTSVNGKINVTSGSAQTAGTFYRTSTTAGDGVVIWYSDTGGANTIRGVLRVDGGIANFSANNSNLSDARTKTEIKDAGNYLAKICAIPVRTFKYIDQTDDLLNLGCIAQEMEAVAPELVDVQGFGDKVPEDGIPLKAIYQTDLQYALMKCIQEQQALITSLTDRIAALEAR